jgi:hypothetical protein
MILVMTNHPYLRVGCHIASPCTDLWLIAIYWGYRTSPWGTAWSCCVGACQEEEASRGIIIGWWPSTLLVHVHEIS